MGRVINFQSPPACPKWDEGLEQFLWFKRAQQRSDNTVMDYERFVRQFFKRFPEAWPDSRKLRVACTQFLADDIKPSTTILD